MRLRALLTGSACALAAAAAGGCGGGDDAADAEAGSPARGVGTTPAQRTPSAPAGSTLLAQLPDSAATRTTLAAVDVSRLEALGDGSHVWADALEATLGAADARVVRAVDRPATVAAATPGTLVVAGEGAEGTTPAVVPAADGREVAAGTGRVVVGRASAEVRSGRPRRPAISLRELSLAQLCAGAAVAERVVGPRAAGLGPDAAGAAALLPADGDASRPLVRVCAIPATGLPTDGIESPLRRGLARAGLDRVGAISETEDDATERVVLGAEVRADERALALLGDPRALADVVTGRG